MRLTKQQTEEISKVILKKLKGMDMVTVNAPEEKVLHRIVEIITKDLMVEEEEEYKVVDEIKRGIANYLKVEDEVDTVVRNKISSYSRNIPAGSREWDVL